MDYTDVNQMFLTYSWYGVVTGVMIHLTSYYLGFITTWIKEFI